jgi:predicted DNA-binding protein
MPATAEKLMPYSVLLTAETKKRLRVHCLERGTTAPQVIRNLIKDYLEKSA